MQMLLCIYLLNDYNYLPPLCMFRLLIHRFRVLLGFALLNIVKDLRLR